MTPQSFVEILSVFKYNPNHDEHGRFSESDSSGAPGPKGGGAKVPPIKRVGSRVFRGKPVETETKMSKQEVGAKGEKIAIAYMQQELGLSDARPLNLESSNFPVDLVGDHQLTEVKTGVVSNGGAAQQWRATIGQPGKAESAWLKKAGPEEKAAWNKAKQQAILDRKHAVLKAFSKRLGRQCKPRTIGIIINPDTRTADVHVFSGFHSRIGWNSALAKSSYVGTFKFK